MDPEAMQDARAAAARNDKEAVQQALAAAFLTATDSQVLLPAYRIVYRLRDDRTLTDFAMAVNELRLLIPENVVSNCQHSAFFVLRLGTHDTHALLIVNPPFYRFAWATIQLSDGSTYKRCALEIATIPEDTYDYRLVFKVYFPHADDDPGSWQTQQHPTRRFLAPIYNDVLRSICRVSGTADYNNILRINSDPADPELADKKIQLGSFFSRHVWTSCVKELHSVHFGNLELADWQWEAIQNLRFHNFYCFGDRTLAVSPQFLQHTPARSIDVLSLGAKQKLAIANRRRDSPIPELAVKWSIANEQPEDWLPVLERVQRFCYQIILGDDDDTTRHPYWLSQTFWSGLRNNSTVTELYFSFGYTASPPNRLVCSRTMGYIHSCLQENWCIETIRLPYCDPDALRYRDAHIEPLLELNKSHQPRISHNESQPVVLMDALLRIHRHTTKSFLFLKTFHHVLFPKADSSKRRYHAKIEADGSRKRVCTDHDDSTA
jgi:hypothetical protein